MEGFDEELEVHVPDREASFFVRLAGRDLATSNGIAFVLHGGGFTGMSWAPAAGIMKSECCVIAPDLRGHGLTRSTISSCSSAGSSLGDGGGDTDSANLSLDTLVEDTTSLLVEIFASGLLGQGVGCRPNEEEGEFEGDTAAHDALGEHGATTEPLAAEWRTAGPLPNASPKKVVEHSSEKSESGGRGVPRSGHVVEGGGGGSGASGANGMDSPELLASEGGGQDSCGAGYHKVLLVGHSLGGSIAVRVAAAIEDFKRRCRGAAEIAGVVAVDIVGGTALAALEDMPEVLSRIPKHFSSVEDAVAWHVKTGAVRNSTSAAVVVPSRLKDDGSGERVVWRTDLRSTERCWRGWFEGMSEAFLSLDMPKLLLVAGMDRLDTELTAAHMQGRFQLKLVYGCGHSVQEDQPRETATSILNFAARFSIFRRGSSGGVTIEGRREEEEEELRRKIARARGQVFGKSSIS